MRRTCERGFVRSEQDEELVSVRYLVDDVQAAIDSYTRHFGFVVRSAHLLAFADVTRGRLRLLLSGPQISGAPPLRQMQIRRAGTVSI